MLLQPRLFKLLQLQDQHSHQPKCSDFSFFEHPSRVTEEQRTLRQAGKMLLVHQAGSVKVGEVVRYTLTYTPSNDRILPTPSHLHLKVRNTCAIPLRAAWIHGPYTLHVAAYPATFNPHHKVENPKRDGVPEYEPMVKAGGSWSSKLLVPEAIRETGAHLGRRRSTQSTQTVEPGKGSVTWIVEIASQILFSNSASIEFEVFVGRDERSLDFGFAAVAGHGHGGPGRIKDSQTERERKEARRRGHVQHDGVYSKAVRLVVEDTETLWDKPALPSWDGEEDKKSRKSMNTEWQNEEPKPRKERKRRNVHLVVVTHGLHSNIGADMLFLKESIDATVAQARQDAKKRKEAYKESQKKKKEHSQSGEASKQAGENKPGDQNETSTAPLSGGQEERDNDAPAEEDDDEEETIVRGFPGNAVKTENGIQYLGKRLAKYILRFTYPDQPFLPVKKNFTRKLTDTFVSANDKAKRDGAPSHEGSSIHTSNQTQTKKAEDLPYKFTSISFVGHSLGGLIQTYAIAYIHKHSPTFFQQIKPINFICMASPMLGLSNENPMYVKFALDFGLVGRTGQDLGLTWRPPTIASKGWNAMMGTFGNGNQKDDLDKKQEDPTAKPLLRILPTGPAHQVLKMFRNRTVYSNVVNDGIVPLRTSCLLFLDWRGLGKVEKARRENGLIGTMAEWGWAELTGANASQLVPNVRAEQTWDSEDEQDEHVRQGEGDAVPQPGEDETTEDNRRQTNRVSYDEDAADTQSRQNSSQASVSKQGTQEQNPGMFNSFISFFRPNTPDKAKSPPPTSKKTTKALRRAQTVYHGDEEGGDNGTDDQDEESYHNPTMRPHMHHLHTGQVQKRPAATRGDSLTSTANGELQAPPKTSIFESAGDILHPPLPSKQWITDPSTRSRTIFHDRVYHPEDIPPPPAKRSGTRLMAFGSDSSKASQKSAASDASIKSIDTASSTESGGMKVEEKIARAYHRDLSWRKVLVRLEPDAHNNMVVRRMFANAYGWPVVKHLCDTHFADTHAARTRDEDEPARERAKPMDEPIDPNTGEQVDSQTDKKIPPRTQSETREARDELKDLNVPREGVEGSYSSRKSMLTRQESAVWDDSYFEGSDGEDSDAVDERNLVARLINPNPAPPKKPDSVYHRPASSHSSGSAPSPISTTVSYTDGHRGLAPMSPASPRSPRSPKTVREVKASTPSKNSLKSTFDSEDVESSVLSNQLVEEPEPLKTPQSPGSMVAPGLRKSVEEQVSPKVKRPTSKGSAGAQTPPD